MPSRKRNQGKARKAKAAAASIDGSKEQSTALRQETKPGENNDIVISGGLRLNAGCKHGFINENDPTRIHTLQKFINIYYVLQCGY